MNPKTLRVRASGTALVQNHEQLEQGRNSFIGRVYKELEGKPGQYGFEPTNEVAEVPNRVEYIRALQSGELAAADDATAKAAGLEAPKTKPSKPDPKGDAQKENV